MICEIREFVSEPRDSFGVTNVNLDKCCKEPRASMNLTFLKLQVLKGGISVLIKSAPR